MLSSTSTSVPVSHRFLPEAATGRDPLLESELHRAALGYIAQQRRLDFSTGVQMQEQRALSLEDTLLMISIVLGECILLSRNSVIFMIYRRDVS